MREIQTSLTERALELLALPNEDCFVLDVGCGSGLSGDCLTEAGHHWIGCDISKDMLVVAKEQEVEGDVVLNDMGQVRAPLRPESNARVRRRAVHRHRAWDSQMWRRVRCAGARHTHKCIAVKL